MDKRVKSYAESGVGMERKHQVGCGGNGKIVLGASREEVKLQPNKGATPPCEQQELKT